MEEDDNEEFEDSDGEEETAVLARTMNYVRGALYFVTDSARFQPPRKRPKYVFSDNFIIHVKFWKCQCWRFIRKSEDLPKWGYGT